MLNVEVLRGLLELIELDRNAKRLALTPRGLFPGKNPFVCGFHQPRPAARENVDAFPAKFLAELFRQPIDAVIRLDARAAEYADAEEFICIAVQLELYEPGALAQCFQPLGESSSSCAPV